MPAWLRNRRIVMIVCLSIIAVTLYAVAVPVHAAVYGSPLVLTFLLAAVAMGSPLLSLRYRALAITLFAAVAVLTPLLTIRPLPEGLPWPWSVPMMLTFFVLIAAITFHHGWRSGLLTLAIGTASGAAAGVIMPRIPAGNSLIVTTSIAVAVYLLAVLFAGRLRLGDALTREREHTAEEQARRELVEERTRIARELHDVVAHGMSLIQVQASTARYRVPTLADDAAQEFDDIAAAARTSLAEMRRILGVLRTEEHTAELAPQSGLSDIPALVETTRSAGAEIATEIDINGEVSPATGLAAYRIVQEALSNAVRHGAGAPISLRVVLDDRALHLTVRNRVDDDAQESAGGYGLRGMTERASLLGGNAASFPDSSGYWNATAVLPRYPLADSQEGNA